MEGRPGTTPAICIVTSHGHRHWRGRMLRPFAVGSGAALYALGLAGSVAFFALGFVLAAWTFGSERDRSALPVEPELMGALWLVCGVATIGGLRHGRRIVLGRRLSVLFLRRFRDSTSTHALTTAARRSLGGRWRLVTLDDEQVLPLGAGVTTHLLDGARLVGRASKAAAAVWGRLMQCAFIGALVSGVLLIDAGGWVSLLAVLEPSDVEVQGLPLPFVVPAEPLSWNAATVFSLSVAAVFLLGPLSILALGVSLLSLVLLPLIVTGNSWFAAEARAGADMQRKLAGERDVEATIAAIRKMRDQVLAPRMLILTVPTAIWQQTVHRLVSVVDICLIDVSDPSEHLLWELDLLVQRPDIHCVYVGELPDLQRLSALAGTGSDPAAARLAASLSGRDVLAYTADRRGVRRFARELRLSLKSETPGGPKH